MAILTGAIKYCGSFKRIRNYMNLHDPRTFAGEKGGANRDLIMNSPVFARCREVVLRLWTYSDRLDFCLCYVETQYFASLPKRIFLNLKTHLS